MRWIAIAVLWPVGLVAQNAAPYLNLDFETSTRGMPWYWNIGAAGFDFALDTSTFVAGTQSLRIQNVSASQNGLGVAGQPFPVDLVRGRHVKVTGWIRTSEVKGFAAIWWRVDGANGTLSLDNMFGSGPAGSTDWESYSFERDVSPDAVDVYFGVFLSGTGTAWFDSLQIEIDHATFVEGTPPYIGEPAQAQLDWVTNTAIPVAGDDPSLALDDLAPLANLIGDAHIVGLGEDTHGTSEFFRMKHRIIEYLASRLGFTIFAIEANMPEAHAMNQYVLNGQGDPKQFLKGMYFWTWNTQEVLDMVQWMHDFNQSGQGRIEFTGFDMQTPDVAETTVENFVARADPGYSGRVASTYEQVKQAATAAFGFATGSFPVPAAAGKHVHYTGYIKTQGVTSGYAGLWWRVDGAKGTLAFDNMSDRGATGTSDWQQFSIDLDVPSNATNINFGVLHAGNGTAWFDTLAITLDGVAYSNQALFDFDFEAPAPVGFGIGSSDGKSYVVQLDAAVAHTGKQSLRSVFVGGGVTQDTVAACTDIVTHLANSRDGYIAAGASAADADWAIQNARIVAQAAADILDPSVRDADMATNIQWIVDQAPPGTRVVLWAHNEHISRQAGAMGSYLAARYGKDYLPLGFAFDNGNYNAVGPLGLGAYAAAPSFPGSIEYVFHETGMSPFLLDLRAASVGDPGSDWLFNDMMFRNIGAIVVDGFDVTHTLTRDFDALIYFEQSTPSTLLPF